jgi:hypothetical protein
VQHTDDSASLSILPLSSPPIKGSYLSIKAKRLRSLSLPQVAMAPSYGRYISSEMISETTNMTIEEAAEIGALLLNGGAGRISDDGDPKRPWLFIATSTREDAEDLYEAFGCRGSSKRRRTARLTLRGVG